MLNTASDYTYNAANITSDVVDIQGRIIPTEDVAGQPHPLRRENLAYLCEMICERLGSQATSNPFWSVPAYRAAVTNTDPAAIGAKIRDLYSHNAQQTGGSGITSPTGFFPPDVTASRFATKTASNAADLILRTAYASHLLALSDCAVPSTLPAPLSANYLRHCFYAAEYMRVREYGLFPLSTNYGTMGGARSRVGTQESADSDGNITTTPISVTANAPSTFSTGSSSGYYVNVGASAPDYAYVFLDPPHPSPNRQTAQYEIWYEGNAGAIVYAADIPSNVRNLVVLFMLCYVTEKNLGTSADSSKYVLMPVAFTPSTTTGGDKIYTAAVDKSFWQSVVTAAFPSANLSLSNSDMEYMVRAPTYNSVVEMEYPSRLPAAWTWTPT